MLQNRGSVTERQPAQTSPAPRGHRMCRDGELRPPHSNEMERGGGPCEGDEQRVLRCRIPRGGDRFWTVFFFGEVLGRFETSISSKPQCEAVSLSIKNIHICTQLPITLPCSRETHSSRCCRQRGLLFQCAVCTNVRCWEGNARSNVGPIWNFHSVCNKIRPSKW